MKYSHAPGVRLIRMCRITTVMRQKNERKEGDETPELKAFRYHLLSLKRSNHTIKQYTLVVRDLLQYLGKQVNEITAQDVAEYQRHLAVDRSYSKNSLYTAVEALQAFFRFTGSDVASGLQRPKRAATAPRYLNEEEMRTLLDTAASIGDREYLLMAVMAYTGVRVSELCAITVHDIDFSNRTLLVRDGKGGTDRIVVLPTHLVERLKQYLSSAKSEFLFPGGDEGHISPRTVQRIVSRVARDAQITRKITPHIIRHTFATTILRKGGDIRFIQALLGHRSVATTQIYTHLDDASLRSMYDRFGPSY